jgi:hypothetical protein
MKKKFISKFEIVLIGQSRNMNPFTQSNTYLPHSFTKLNVFFVALEMLDGRLQIVFQQQKQMNNV